MDTHNTHSKRWIVDRATLKQARADDLQYVDEPEYLDFLAIYFANGMSHLPPIMAGATFGFSLWYLFPTRFSKLHCTANF